MMVQGLPLEERETCYYKDDSSIDPDIALSYIGDKVQSILGHLQKDFEGEVSAENLGAKYGGYGSFLPMHQRSPSIWLQPKSPPRVQTPHFPKSPNVCPERDKSCSSPSMGASHTLKTSSDGASIRQKPTLSSGKVAEACRAKVEVPSSKSGNPFDRTKLKFRIKVGPERVAQYNAQISSLGLTTPSSSEGNSHDGSDGILPDSHETHNESPAYMLKMMTSFPVSDGLLLSPLCEDLLNLAKEREVSVKSECEAAPKTSGISVKLLNNDVSRGNKKKIVDRSGNSEKSAENFIEDLSDLKTLDGDNMNCNMQLFRDLSCRSLTEVKDSDKHALVRKRKGSKGRLKGGAVSGDLVLDSSLEHTSEQSFGWHGQPESRFSSVDKIEEHITGISQKDVSVGHRPDSRNRGKGNRSSLKVCSDYSEGKGVTEVMNDSIVKGGQKSASSEHNGFDPYTVGRLTFEVGKKSKGSQTSGKKASKAENWNDGDCAAPKTKLSVKNVCRPNLSQKDVAQTLKHTENPKRSLERPSGDMPKKFNPDGVKAKSAPADKLERSSKKKYFANVASESHVMEPPAMVVNSKEGMCSGLEQTVAAPGVINDEWVACDRCEKWRLLPYGRLAEQLPENWLCSMLDWLPGMNRCDISEDVTTAAVNASYLVPENQHSFAHANGTMAGGISSGAHGFNQTGPNHSSDHIKQQKMKEKQNLVSMNHSLPCNGKQQMQRLALKNGSSRDVKLSLPGVNATNKSDMRHPNISATVSAKLNKRKGEHVIGDESNPKKKFKESGEYADGKAEMRRIKSKDALTVDNFQTSGGNLNMTAGQSVNSGLPIKVAMKNAKKKSAQKDGISGGPGIGHMYVKKHGDMQDLPDNGMEMCNGRELTTKKIRLKDYAYGKYQVETGQNGSHLQDRKVSLNEDTKDIDFHRNKKARVSQVEEGFRRIQDSKSLKRKSAEARVQSSGSKQYPMDGSVEKEQQVKQPIAKLRLTVEDLDKLRKDLGCEQLSTAATSSSSKVSDSRKNRPSYLEQRGSPEESVSSSPMRMHYPNQVSGMMMETEGKVDFRLDGVGAVGTGKKFLDMHESSELGTSRKRRASGLTVDKGSEILDSKIKLEKVTVVDDNSLVPKHAVSGNFRHSLSYESNLKSSKNSASVGKKNLKKSSDSKSEKPSAQRENDKKDLRSSHSCSKDVMQQNLKLDPPKSSIEQAQMEPWNGKVHLDLRQGDKQGALVPNKNASGSSGSLKRSPVGSKPYVSVLGGTSKGLKGTGVAFPQDGSEKYISNEAEQYAILGNKNVSGVTASTASKAAEDVLKEAEELRTHADLIKNSGFSSESNYEYFKAALKFLHGASLLEACNGEPNKQLETRPMQMYGAAAQLCKTCANEYEKSHELAAASLAYKCVEVAYMRVVYFKSSNTSRVWQDLQTTLQMVPQGESPSSSASDVDNLNNLAIGDKAPLSKVSGSLAGNHVIVPRNRPNFVRLLDFTKDVNSAMEAAKKSQEAFAAAQAELEKSNKDATVSIKRAIDFSFQDVEELVRLVLLAFNTINHQGFRGNPE